MKQMGLATTMYVIDFQQYTGSLSTIHGIYYVWPPRLLPFMGNNRNAFWCPAALADSAWNTNVNKTLGQTDLSGLSTIGMDKRHDAFLIRNQRLGT